MVWIKICGITNLEDAKAISRLGVDAVGFVLSTDSPRRVELETAEKIIKVLKREVSKVSMAGVFVNEEIERVIKFSKILGLNYIQLSGDEEENYMEDLRKKSGRVKIIKSIKIRDENYETEINEKIERSKKYADFILLDSYRKDIYGGTGITFNWEVVKDYGNRIPVILSGGLASDNIKRAVDIVKPFGVDASSRLEIYPGKKDLDKVTEFVNILK